MTRPIALATLAIAALAIPLASCASGPAALPEGITVSVFQNRFDYSLRQMEIKVANATDDTVTVTSASLDSTRWSTPAVWDRPQDIPSGSARDLKVLLGEAECAAAELTDSVTLEITLSDGTTARGSLVPTDETGRLETVYAQDCLGAEVTSIAALTPPEAVRWTPGAHGPLSLDIAVTPTGADGTLTIHRAKGTVLLSLYNEGGAPLDVLPLERVVDAASGASVIHLLIEPSRCDPHAIAEDKRGTFIPLDVSTSQGKSGTIYVAMSDAVRLSIYEFVGDYCGFP